MALTLKIGKQSLLGNYRENNEDAVDVKQFPNMTVCVVADGMGGQAAGEQASKLATEIIPREVKNRLGKAKTMEEIQTGVRQAVVKANQEIIAAGQADQDLRNMGTTVVLALWLKDDKLYVAGVGDSRGYMVRNGEIEQLTIDHSLAQALVEAGTISADEAREHRFKNVLWKYLGSKEVGDGPDVKAVTLKEGDKFLLCTDGLCGVVPDDKVRDAMLEQSDPQQCAEVLCQLALDSGSRDNVSCVVIETTND